MSKQSIMFSSRDMAMALWAKLVRWWDLDIPVCANISDWFDWLSSLHVSNKVKSILEGVGGTLMWIIWSYRNRLIFSNSPPKNALLWDSIFSQSYLWISYKNPKFRISWVDWLFWPELKQSDSFLAFCILSMAILSTKWMQRAFYTATSQKRCYVKQPPVFEDQLTSKQGIQSSHAIFMATSSPQEHEETIRADLLFDDADGIDCFPKQVIWDSLRDIGYEAVSQQEKHIVRVLILGRKFSKDAQVLLIFTISNDYTPTYASQTSGGDEGLLDLYALNRELRRLKKQSISQAKQIYKLQAKPRNAKGVKPLSTSRTSDVKSGDTEELDLERIQSTARQSAVTPRTLNFDDEAGPSSPIRPTQEESLKNEFQ
ncbi:hypothetical protein Tco_1227303 [Tanacetum coccineum]